MKKHIAIILFMVFSYTIKAQIFEDICSIDGSPELKSATLIEFNDIGNEPIKYVRVNLIFLRKTDGTGGFQENDPDHQAYIGDKINNANNFMQNIPPNYDTHCYDGSAGTLGDSKIRFVFNTMYVDNTTYWNNHTTSGSCQVLPSNLVPLSNSIIQSSQHPAINVFYTEDNVPYDNIVVNQNCPNDPGIPSTSCTWWPSSSDFNYNQNVHMRNQFTKYYWMLNCVVGNSNWDSPSEETVYSWLQPGRIEAHELAHNLNLDDIDEPNGDCAEHLMMHNSGGYGNFLSPLEIATMHRALSFTSARRYVPEDTYSSTPIQVSQNVTWDEDMRIYRGINIINGATLDIQNNIIIPSETEIAVTGSSDLIVDGSIISTPHTDDELDISINNSEANISNSTIMNCNFETNSAVINLDNSSLELGNSGEFVINIGSELLMTNSIIQ
jgi:hypothetical protein